MMSLIFLYFKFQVTPDLHSSENSPNSSISLSPSGTSSGTSSEESRSPQNHIESGRLRGSKRRNLFKFQHSVLSSADMTTNIKSAAKKLERDE